MKIHEFLHRARAERVQITLTDGAVHTGSFRTDILGPTALSAYFFGDIRPLSLSIDDVVACEALPSEAVAS